MKDFRLDRYNNNRPRRNFVGQFGSRALHVVNTMFQEPVHKVLEKIKNEPYFKWPNKMGGYPLRHKQSLYCQYHQEQGYTIEDCRTLWNHLKQLIREGRLQQFLYQPNGHETNQGQRLRGMLL